MKSLRLPLAMSAVAALLGCTQEILKIPKKEVRKAVDNLIEVQAQFATAPPRNQVFPVKIMLILDASGSLQFLDEGGVRVSAIRSLLSRFEGDPQVSFNIIQFNSIVYQTPGNGTFGNPVDISDTQLQLAEVLTDYQAALGRAYQTLLTDMTRSSAAAQNTKYVVIFFSDGSPSPVCCPCEDETPAVGSTQRFTCDMNGNPDPPPPSTTVGSITYEERYCENTQEIPFCNTDIDRTGGGRIADVYQGLQTNGSYNRGYQIEQLMRDIVDLGTTFEVGSLQFHTVLLYNPDLPAEILRIVGVDYPTASARMRTMAAIGGGTYVEARNTQELDFLQFDYAAIKRPFGLRRLFVQNLNASPGPTGPRVDSDGDGVPDEDELAAGSNQLRSDTDGDGYRDLLEIRMATRGMDVTDPSVPFEPCPPSERTDLDRDLLLQCEERFLNTLGQLTDSDFDTIPDGVEVRFGLDPLLNDADLDYDFDGTPNGEEVNRGTDPRLEDPVARQRGSIRYRLQDEGETVDSRQRFALEATNIQLQATQGRDGLNQPGWNDLLLWEVESPLDNGPGATQTRVACFRGRYIPPDFKLPPDGAYPRLRDEELQDVFDRNALQKCWGPPLPVMP